MPMNCDGGDDQPVVMIITNQVAVETVALCAEHFVEWVLMTYGTMTAGDDTPEPVPAPSAPVAPPAVDVPLPGLADTAPVPGPTTGRDRAPRGRKPRTAASGT